MSWATNYIKQLQEGKAVSFRPRGNSMSGKIESGQLVTVQPVGNTLLKKGDIVLCKVNGRHYLHLIKSIKFNRYLIGNNKGGVNGWIDKSNIFGVKN